MQNIRYRYNIAYNKRKRNTLLTENSPAMPCRGIFLLFAHSSFAVNAKYGEHSSACKEECQPQQGAVTRFG